VIDDGFEVVLQQPLRDQLRLRQRAPDLFRRTSDLAFDDDGNVSVAVLLMGPSFIGTFLPFASSFGWSNRREIG
jgi:hypothetical protein